jgi:hypothetical protein
MRSPATRRIEVPTGRGAPDSAHRGAELVLTRAPQPGHLPAETARTSTSFTVFEGMPEIQRMFIGRAVTRLDSRSFDLRFCGVGARFALASRCPGDRLGQTGWLQVREEIHLGYTCGYPDTTRTTVLRHGITVLAERQERRVLGQDADWHKAPVDSGPLQIRPAVHAARGRRGYRAGRRSCLRILRSVTCPTGANQSGTHPAPVLTAARRPRKKRERARSQQRDKSDTKKRPRIGIIPGQNGCAARDLNPEPAD